MSTRLEYNGVVFHGCKTVDFSQRVVADPSGTDIERHEFSIAVQGIVHKWTAAPQWVEGSGGSTVESGPSLMADLQGQLMQYRRRLAYIVDDKTILEVYSASSPGGGGSDVDVDNGPKPEVLQITHVARQVFRVIFTVKCSVVKCKDGGSRTPEVLSNRWSFEDSLDENMVLTRTMDGRIRTSSIHHNPQSFRHLVIPPLPSGFRLIGAKFVQDKNALEMAYTITQRREHASPPPPAVNWTGRHEVSTVRGGIAESRLALVLTGETTSDKRALIGAAVVAAEARLGPITRSMEELGKRGIVLESISIVDHFEKPVVELAIHLRHAQAESMGTAAGVPQGLGKHLAIPGYNHRVWPQPATFAPDSLSEAFRQRLINPCFGPFSASGDEDDADDEAERPSRGTPNGGRSGYETFVVEGNPAVGSFEAKLSGYKTRVSADTRQNLYTYYTIKNRYTTRGYRVAVPIARSVDADGNIGGEDEPSVFIASLGPGVAQRIVHIQAERVGTYPQLPAPEDIDADIPQYLLEPDVVLHAPELLPDGASQLFRVEAKYVYALERPPRVNEKVPVGSLPLDTTAPKDNEYRIATGARIL